MDLPIIPLQEQTIVPIVSGDGDVARQQLSAALEEVGADPAVRDARAKHEAALDHQRKLGRAHGVLNGRAAELARQATERGSALVRRVIETAAMDQRPSAKECAELSTLRAESALTAEAISSLVRVEIPAASASTLRAEWVAGDVEANTCERIANQRAEKLRELVSEAAKTEGAFVIDLKTSVSGLLVAYAAELRRKGEAARVLADEIEKQAEAWKG